MRPQRRHWLIALAVAFLLVITRLSVRRRKKGATGIFPEITPAPTPSPAPEGTNPAAERSVNPAGQAFGVVTNAPAASALVGLIALAVAFLLMMTRLFVRRRTSRRGPGA